MTTTTTDVQQRRFRRAQWGTLLALMFCYLFYYLGRHNYGWAFPYMQAELDLTYRQLGVFSMVLLLCYGIGQFVNGNLGDKFGGRKMLTLGGLLSVAFNWLTSFATSFVTLLVPWAANGFAQSMGWAPGSRMLSNWWDHSERGKAFGFYVFSAGCSGILVFVICGGINMLVQQEVLSWRAFFQLPLLLLAGGCIVFYLVARNRPEDLGFPPIEDDPEHGPTIIGGEEGPMGTYGSLDESREDSPPGSSPAPSISDTANDKNSVQETSLQRYIQVIGNGPFLLATLSIGFESLARYGLIVWLPSHLLGDAYRDQPLGFWIGMALPIGMALGALSTGFISDKLFASNRSRPIALLMMLAAIVLLVFYLVPAEWLVLGVILLFLAGFFVYGPQSCYWALCPDLLGRHRAATAIGVMNMWAYFVAAVTDPLIGGVIDLYGTAPVFALLAVSCLLGAIVILPVRR